MGSSTINSSGGRQYQQIRTNPQSVMDLNDITETGTTFTTNPNPGNNETHLISGLISRVGTRAHCELRLITDDQSFYELIFGTSIVPAGAEITSMFVSGQVIHSDQINARIEVPNIVSLDIANGLDTDRNITVSFWVDGLPDFQEYVLQEI